LILILFSLSYVSASWFSDFLGRITGNAVKTQISCIDSDLGDKSDISGNVFYQKNGKTKLIKILVIQKVKN